eukprot:CAMPEP_0171244842 /NCGR_PEP_ID=MMETSP0790-20130122/47078_1 /TAXON_ID=2925 /ORGANISM="Alexandrium catenella, Strain OF101" /LENGTH=90 /DNA_ID=CAMNT_0011712013 /DNA_START=31 /DNA_END=299 /DNA_ORIENTATION=+
MARSPRLPTAKRACGDCVRAFSTALGQASLNARLPALHSAGAAVLKVQIRAATLALLHASPLPDDRSASLARAAMRVASSRATQRCHPAT